MITISLEMYEHLIMTPALIFSVVYGFRHAKEYRTSRLRAVFYNLFMVALGFAGTYGAGALMSWVRVLRGLEGNVRLAIFGAIYAVFFATLLSVPLENGIRALLRRAGKHAPSVSLLDTWDLLEPGAFMFMLFAKVRCLCAGCCYGIPCSWGIYSSYAKTRVFPVQLVEIIMTASILITVYHLKRKPSYRRGTALFLAAAGFSIGRFLLEYLKYYVPEDRTYLGCFTFWQIALVIVLVVCIGIIRYLKKTRPPEPYPQNKLTEWEQKILQRLHITFPKKAPPKKHHGGEWQSTKKKYKKKK